MAIKKENIAYYIVLLGFITCLKPSKGNDKHALKVTMMTTILSENLEPNADTVNNANLSVHDDIDTFVPYRSDSLDHFSWLLLKTVLIEDNSKNVIISPFSVKLVLALLSEAAGANTSTQMELINTQTDIKSQSNIREFYRKTLNSFKKENQLHNALNFRTKLFADSFIETQQRFASNLKYFYDTEIENVNFQETEIAAGIINLWASNMTNGRLRNLVNEKNLLNSVMLLTNVIYFNGLWLHQFTDSYQGVFFQTQDHQSRVDYIEQTEYFFYFNSDKLNAKILRLPYKGKCSMFILLPNESNGINELMQKIENKELKSAIWMMDAVKVKVTLPKFHFDYNHSFKETLNQLGVKEIFSDNASLPGLTRGASVAGKLKVSNIIQKAGIDVNEKGTEAFAATVVEIENKFGGSSVIQEFNVNRPFVFFIEVESTGNILFAGKVLQPNSA